MATRRKRGSSNVEALDAIVESLRSREPVDTFALATAQIARTLADILDAQRDGIPLAPIAKEYRETIKTLAGLVNRDDDDDDGDIRSRVPSAVRHPPEL